MMEDYEFTLTEDHLLLLRRAVVRWEDCEYGAPAIDCKRPYGNSNVEGDIAKFLGWDWDPDRSLTAAQSAEAQRLHKQTKTALQIVLATGSFVPGHYAAPRYTSKWRLVSADSDTEDAE